MAQMHDVGFASEDNIAPWRLSTLLDSDRAIRWQAMRDLTDASPEAVGAERGRVAREGVGAEIATGVDRAEPTIDSAVARLEAGFRWDEEFGKKPFFEGEAEPCINGGTLALGAYFGRPTTSETPVSSPMRASAMPCVSSRAGSRPTVDGFSIARTTRRSPSRSVSPWASRVGGTRSGRCVCSVGTGEHGSSLRFLRSHGRVRVKGRVYYKSVRSDVPTFCSFVRLWFG
jgi:hypothetical protein